MNMKDDIAALIKGDVADDAATLETYSHDTSIFERKPSLVVFPKDTEDVSAIVRYVHGARARGENISIAPRSAGSDMTGGPLTDSISLVFTKYMNHMLDIGDSYATAEPGIYYRDFEKLTLARNGKLLPSYPASREICALGGMVANNSGGELTLRYGQTNCYVHELEVVLANGSPATLHPLNEKQLAAKEAEQDFEGEIYRKTHALIRDNIREIEAARPDVSKNSAGYALWNIWNETEGIFDLTQLITGSQGTLAIVTKATVGLVHPKEHKAMLVVFLSELNTLPEVVRRVLEFKPESFESYDDQTFRLAVRFIPQIIRHFGLWDMIKLGVAFIPEMFVVATGGVPKLVLMAEFAEDSDKEARRKTYDAQKALADLSVSTRVEKSETARAKFWTIRRESFSLLRKNLRGLHAASFIDDLVVHPADYPLFLPELTQILEEHDLLYTIAGHIGDADFHIIPLMDLSKRESRAMIMELEEKVYRLIAKYKGSITGEHNDGIVRTPYLPLMFSPRTIELFAEIKHIFDPLGILNPGKKVGGTVEDIKRSMMTHAMGASGSESFSRNAEGGARNSRAEDLVRA
ncbi:FAD-binding oxidoreductase [Candidatus Kaiserbacteria bacterium]|nr:FAD-binding oxidoreductase [Candidatus Kaiserbacteria bacterium]